MSSSSSSSLNDYLHNHNHPSCRTLHDWTKQILQLNQCHHHHHHDNNNNKDETASFTQCVLMELQHSLPPPPDDSVPLSTIGAQKKRRKKKKKKKTLTSVEQPPPPQYDEKENDESSSVPPIIRTHHHTTTTTITHSPTVTTTDKPGFVPIISRTRVLQDFLRHRTSSVSSNDHPTHEFWDRIVSLLQTSSTTTTSHSKSTGGGGGGTGFVADQTSLVAAIATIQCPSCQQSVSNCLLLDNITTHTNDTLSSVSAKSSMVVVQDGWKSIQQELDATIGDTNDEEGAFDYVRLEEGLLPPLPPKVVFCPSTTNDKNRIGFVLQRQGPTNEQQAKEAVSLEWSRELVRDMLVYYVMAQGLSDSDVYHHLDTTTTTTTLSANMLRSLSSTVDSKCRKQNEILKGFADTLLELTTMFTETEGHNVNNIDMANFSKMKQVDDGCSALLQTILEFMVDITKVFLNHTHATTAANDDGSVSTGQLFLQGLDRQLRTGLLQFWSDFARMLRTLQNNHVEFDNQRLPLLDRHGAFPQPFYCSTYRSIYRQLVDSKILTIHKLIVRVSKTFDASVASGLLFGPDRNTTFIRKLDTQQIYQEVIGECQAQQIAESSEVDSACYNLMSHLRECTETILGPSPDPAEHTRRRERFIRLRNVAGQQLDEFSKVTPGTSLGVLIDESDPLAGDKVESEFVNLIQSWMDTRMAARRESSVATKVMPVEVLNTMRHRRVDGQDDSVCYGGGNGKERATCILVGLLFQWMSSVYDEWRAELAQQELLKSMEDLEEPLGPVGAGKPGKKKNKKKKQGPENTPVPNNVQNVETSPAAKVNDPDPEKTTSPPDSSKPDIAKSSNEQVNGSSTRPTETVTATAVDQKDVPVFAQASSWDVQNVPGLDEFEKDDAWDTVPSKSKKSPSRKDNKSRTESKKRNKKHISEETVSSAVAKASKGPNEQKSVDREAAEVKTVPPDEGSEATDGVPEHSLGNKEDEEKPNSSPIDVTSLLCEIDANVSIGVYDRSKFLSAEEFLVGRYIAALKSK